ncbi:Clp protease N-terminal domain-containing protein [Dactylosporangium sp. NPDC050688]|uniref:Clp protease N-terminal domain-containing protein n=1 Tax=Dactylosporangium sp. NPDC050688 TaxID=3157217 RepID=UPI0033D4760D
MAEEPELGGSVAGTLRMAALMTARRAQPPRVVDASTLLMLSAGGESSRVKAVQRVVRRVTADPGYQAWRPPATPWTDGLLDDAGSGVVSQALREALLAPRATGWPKGGPVRWHVSVAAALWAALDEARQAGVGVAGHIHLVAGLLRDPAGALEGVRADADELIAALRAEPAWREPGEPHLPAVAQLDMARELHDRTGLLGWFDRRLRDGEVGDSRYGSAVAPSVMWEAMRQAVRLDDGPVTAAHLLLGVVSTGAQLRTAGRTLREGLRPYDSAPDVLHAHGLTARRAVELLPAVRPADPVVVPKGRSQRVIRTIWPAWTAEAVGVVDRAVELARAAGHPATGSSHLVLAALHDAAAANDTDGTAVPLLRAAGADPAAVRAAVEQGLAAVEAAPSPGRRADRSPAKARRLSP